MDHQLPLSLPVSKRSASDEDLVARFVSRRDERAFEDLIRRHGPMVFGVCRRLLGDFHEAEDAFQAVFVVLARRAHRLKRGCSVGGWLHGVALRVARKAKAHLQRSAHLRQKVEDLPNVAAKDAPSLSEIADVLDRELDSMPEKERAAIVLCDLEGLSHEEAARELKVPTGTVSSHLTRGRRRLGDRLKRRGFQVGALALLPAAVPEALAQTTLAASLSAKTGAVTAGAAALSKWFLLTRPTVRVVGTSALVAVLLGVLSFTEWKASDRFNDQGEKGPTAFTVQVEATLDPEAKEEESTTGTALILDFELEPR